VRVRYGASPRVGLGKRITQVGLGEGLLREGVNGCSHGGEGKRACGCKKFEVHGRFCSGLGARVSVFYYYKRPSPTSEN